MGVLANIRKAWNNYRRPWHDRRDPVWFRDAVEAREPRIGGEPKPSPHPAEYEAETDEQP